MKISMCYINKLFKQYGELARIDDKLYKLLNEELYDTKFQLPVDISWLLEELGVNLQAMYSNKCIDRFYLTKPCTKKAVNDYIKFVQKIVAKEKE